MLVLSMKSGDVMQIGDNIITCIQIKSNRARLGIVGSAKVSRDVHIQENLEQHGWQRLASDLWRHVETGAKLTTREVLDACDMLYVPVVADTHYVVIIAGEATLCDRATASKLLDENKGKSLAYPASMAVNSLPAPSQMGREAHSELRKEGGVF